MLDPTGAVVRSFCSLEEETRKAQAALPPEAPRKMYLTANAGWNRFVWDLRYEEATRLEAHDVHAGAVDGPLAAPGSYTLRLSVGDETLSHPFEVRQDPQSDTPQEDLQEQFDLLATHPRPAVGRRMSAVNRMRQLRTRLNALAERADVDGGDDRAGARATRAGAGD